jgi:hypothetical protein
MDPHVTRQLDPEQLYGAQSCVWPSGVVTVWAPSQEAPLFGTQARVGTSQRRLASQSLSLAQEVPQTAPEQMYGEQVTVTRSWHVPLPVHEAGTVATPAAHEAARHATLVRTKPAHESTTTLLHVAARNTTPPG